MAAANPYAPVHHASSASWGDESCARLCGLVVDSNNAAAQQIQENRHDLLDLMSKEELNKPVDDIGLTLPFLAVYYDRPDMLRYLLEREVDLTKPCDPFQFGTPMFYAVTLCKNDLVERLDNLGCSVNSPCDIYNQLPIEHAKRMQNLELIALISHLMSREERAGWLFLKHFLRRKLRRRYVYMVNIGIPLLQRAMRGMFGRKIGREKRNARDRILRHEERDERRRQGIDVDSDEEELLIRLRSKSNKKSSSSVNPDEASQGDGKQDNQEDNEDGEDVGGEEEEEENDEGDEG